MEDLEIHHALVDRLVTTLRPVRRLRLHRLFSAWILSQGAVLALLLSRVPRPDIEVVLHRPLFVVEIVLLTAAGTLAAWLAAAAAFPHRAPSSRSVLAVAALATCGLMPFVAGPAVTGTSLNVFIARGWPCCVMTIMVAAVPWLGLLLLVARGASLTPARAGLFAGAAALLLAAAGMRVACSIDEPLHLVVWHAAPVLLGAGVSSLVGAALLGRWAVFPRLAERR